jgi:hypothetical protein
MELLENIRPEFQQVNPSEFTIIIYERHIIFISADRVRGGPHTSEKMSSNGCLDTLTDLG